MEAWPFQANEQRQAHNSKKGLLLSMNIGYLLDLLLQMA